MKKLIPLVPLLVGLSLSQNVLAQDSAVRVRAGVAAVSFVAPSTTPGSPDLESDYTALVLGGSYVTANGWFGDATWRGSAGAKWNTGEVVGIPGVEDQDFSRNEVTLTAGKFLGDGLSVFGGAQFIQSELDIAGNISVTGNAESITVDDTVLFVGVAKSFSIGNGSLNVSGALGVMNEETSFSAGLNSPAEDSDNGFGYSLGAGYSHPLTSFLSIQADLRYQSYSVKYQGEASDQKVTAAGVAVVGQF